MDALSEAAPHSGFLKLQHSLFQTATRNSASHVVRRLRRRRGRRPTTSFPNPAAAAAMDERAQVEKVVRLYYLPALAAVPALLGLKIYLLFGNLSLDSHQFMSNWPIFMVSKYFVLLGGL